MNIPDLRDEPEITAEHCSVLLEKLGYCLEQMYDDPSIKAVALEADVYAMVTEFTEVFQPTQFSKLFKTELGKGMLIGVFFQRFILNETGADHADQG